MLAQLRVSAALRAPARIRAYSYFSQRPGRFFSASKPAAEGDASSSRRRKIVRIGSSSEPSPDSTPVETSSTESSLAAGVEQNETSSSPSSSSAPGTQQQQQSQSNSQPSRVSSIPPTAPLLHPQPQLPSLHLHEFFAQHRPLLLLDQPIPSLFTSSSSELSSNFPNPSSSTTASAYENLPQSILEDAAVARAIGLDLAGHEHPSEAETDADVARMLARALVVQRIQANRDWGSILTQLGLGTGTHDEQAVRDVVVNLDSVKRKRRRKMNKHKYVSSVHLRFVGDFHSRLPSLHRYQKRRKVRCYNYISRHTPLTQYPQVQRAERRRMGK